MHDTSFGSVAPFDCRGIVSVGDVLAPWEVASSSSFNLKEERRDLLLPVGLEQTLLRLQRVDTLDTSLDIRQTLLHQFTHHSRQSLLRRERSLHAPHVLDRRIVLLGTGSHLSFGTFHRVGHHACSCLFSSVVVLTLELLSHAWIDDAVDQR